MIYIYLAIIFVLAFTGGGIPLIFRKMPSYFINYLLAFTGAFLLGITLLHLMPESFRELGNRAGICITAGFCLQVFLQEFSHGMEHSHSPVSTSSVRDHSALPALLFGLSIHAFMEGIPLGYHYTDNAALLSLALAISFHKVPEAFTLMTVVLTKKERLSRGWLFVSCFAAVTPFAALLVLYLGDHFAIIAQLLQYIIAIVIGSFLQISTTIFYESGTRHHELSRQKVTAIMLGFLLVVVMLAFD
jgi:zinc transporter ZupT